MKRIKYILSLFIVSGLFLFQSCTDDLNVDIEDPDEVGQLTSFSDVQSAIAKVYAGLALSGQQGPSGNGDISGVDEGFGQYIRAYWQLQELPTDEVKIAWNDGTLQTLNFQTWTSQSEFILAAYSRFLYEVELSNQFLRDTEDGVINSMGLTDAQKQTVAQYRAEARWLRALGYYHAMDFFGNLPFKTDADPVGISAPPVKTRTEIFNYIESELLEIKDLMVEARQNEYGRVDRAAAWALLARMYLNAEVYTGTPRYTDCVNYCEQIIASGYSLAGNYQDLFLSDNDQGAAKNEIIFAVPYDGNTMQTYGGTTFILNASIGGDVNPAQLGVSSGGWGGIRTTKALVYLFNSNGDLAAAQDNRCKVYNNGEGIFNISGQSLEMDDITQFSNGYAVLKYKNINSDGTAGNSGNGNNMSSVDYPLFRLGDVYLMWTEAKFKASGTKDATYVNLLRNRAGATAISNGDISDDFILAERGRELYWEGLRRTDLIRFGKFSGSSYVWPWKGGTAPGATTSTHYNLYPIPSSDLAVNPNLSQNPGY